jgi:tetratricopeptide (TPR) repeat protein
MGPVSNLIPIGVVRADRLLYTPSLYVCVAVAAALGLLERAATRSGVRTPLLLPLLGVLVFGFTLRLGENVSAWSTDVNLWETSLSHFNDAASLESGRCNLALGKYKLNDPALELEAQAHFEAAIVGLAPPERWAKYAAEARWGLAMTLMSRAPDRARQLLATAHTIDPGSRSVALGRARLHLMDAERTEDLALRRRWLHLAEQSARAGVRFASTDYDLWLLLGTVLTHLEKRDAEAEAAFNRAVERSDFPWQALMNRGRLRFGVRDFVGALSDYREVTALLEPALRSGQLTNEMRTLLPDVLLRQTVLALETGARQEAEHCHRLLRSYFPTHPGLAKLEDELRRRRDQQ